MPLDTIANGETKEEALLKKEVSKQPQLEETLNGNIETNSQQPLNAGTQKHKTNLKSEADPLIPADGQVKESSPEGISGKATQPKIIPGESVGVSPIPDTIYTEPFENILPNIPNGSIPHSPVNQLPPISQLPPSLATVLSYSGAHTTQINVSPEDMEYNRVSDSYPEADLTSISTIATSILMSVHSSVTASLQGRVDTSHIVASSVFPSASSSSISEGDNHIQAEESIPPKMLTKTDLLNEVSTEATEVTEGFEVIDGTTLFADDKPTAPTKEPPPILQSSFPSISPTISQSASQNMVIDTGIISTKMTVASVVLDGNNTDMMPQVPRNDQVIDENQVEEKEMSPTQAIDNQQYASPNPEILPSVTSGQEFKSELPTPTLELSSQPDRLGTGLTDENAIRENEAQDHPSSTAMPDIQVSTENLIDSTGGQKMLVNNEQIEIAKTDEYKTGSNDLPSIGNTVSPNLQQQPGQTEESVAKEKIDDVSQVNTEFHDIESQENVEVIDDNQLERQKPEDEEMSERDSNEKHDTNEEDVDPFQDYDDNEDQDDDEDAIENEQLTEERKKIVEENLKLASEKEQEILVDQELKNVDAATEATQNNDQVKNIADTDNANIEGNGENEVVDKNSDELNKNKGFFDGFFGNSDDVVEGNRESDTHEILSEGSIEKEVTDENYLVQEDQNDAVHGDTGIAIGDLPEVESTLKNKGDDIRFYEPSDMLPSNTNLDSESNLESEPVDKNNLQPNAPNIEHKETTRREITNNGKNNYNLHRLLVDDV